MRNALWVLLTLLTLLSIVYITFEYTMYFTFMLGLLFVVCLFLIECKQQKAGISAVLFSDASKDNGISAGKTE